MKKLITILLSLALAVVLVGCTSDTAQQAPPSGDVVETTVAPAQTEVEETATQQISAEQLMQNSDVRKAIAHAFDKSYIANTIISNGSQSIDYLVPAGLSIAEDGSDFRDAHPIGWHHYDIELAHQYWQKARAELNFNVAKLRLLSYDSPIYQKVSQYIKEQLERNLEGLEVVIIQQPFSNKIALAKAGKYDIEYTGWGPDYPDVMTFLDLWVSNSSQNKVGYASARYDDYVARAKQVNLQSDITMRMALLQQAEQLLIEEDCVLIPLYQRGISLLQSPKVKGIVHHQFGGDYSYAQATTQSVTDGKRIIRLTCAIDIPSLDNSKAVDVVSQEAIGNVLEGLTKLGIDDMMMPAGAKSWKISQDGRVYTFDLVEDAVWSNGVPVTADDYVYSWRRLADPKTESQYQDMISTAQIAGGAAVINGERPVEELGVTALDDYTLQVKLERAVPYFLKLMSIPSFYPLNQSFVEAQGEAFGSSTETTLYNGPYVVADWQAGSGYKLVKNQSYWNRANVLNDGVNFRIVKDALAAVNLYELGEVDRVEIKGEFAQQYLDHPHFKVEKGSAVFFLALNMGNHLAD